MEKDSNDYYSLYKLSIYPDVSFIINGKERKLHKDVIINKSQFFKKIIENNEWFNRDKEISILTKDLCSEEHLENIIEYMYNDTWYKLTKRNADIFIYFLISDYLILDITDNIFKNMCDFIYCISSYDFYKKLNSLSINIYFYKDSDTYSKLYRPSYYNYRVGDFQNNIYIFTVNNLTDFIDKILASLDISMIDSCLCSDLGKLGISLSSLKKIDGYYNFLYPLSDLEYYFRYDHSDFCDEALKKFKKINDEYMNINKNIYMNDNSYNIYMIGMLIDRLFSSIRYHLSYKNIENQIKIPKNVYHLIKNKITNEDLKKRLKRLKN